MIWFKQEEPQFCATVARWAGIKDWILYRLCGSMVIDHSLASCSGLMNLHRLDWDTEALELAGITADQLPELLPTTTVLPRLSDEAVAATDLPADTPVVLGAGDGPLANLGVGAVAPGVAACSIGTSGALRITVDSPTVDPNGGVFCYALTEDRWVVGGAINNGGVTLDWVHGELADDLDLTGVLDLACRAPVGSGGLLMLPYLLSERAPHWDSNARGAYIGLTRAHGREHLVRAAVEGVCLQLSLVQQSMRAAGLAIDEVRATGGVMQHQLWQHSLAAALGAPIGLLPSRQGSGFGAALLGMQALGLIDSIDLAAELLHPDTTISPAEESIDTLAALRPIFDGLYQSLAASNLQLRQLGLRTTV